LLHLLLNSEVVRSDEITHVLWVGEPRDSEARLESSAHLPVRLLMLHPLLVPNNLAEDSAMASVLVAHPLGCCLLRRWSIPLRKVVVAVVAGQDQVVAPWQSRRCCALMHLMALCHVRSLNIEGLQELRVILETRFYHLS